MKLFSWLFGESEPDIIFDEVRELIEARTGKKWDPNSIQEMVELRMRERQKETFLPEIDSVLRMHCPKIYLEKESANVYPHQAQA